jgi:UDP-glucose 4-epimerase
LNSEWIAVTGGCGYIGSHIACELRKNTNYKLLIIDRNASNMKHTHWLADELIDGDILSYSSSYAIAKLKPKAIIHCAGTSLVGPSISDPAEYYNNNVCKTMKLLDLMHLNNINNIIFSSSAAVYGRGFASVCSEHDIPNPINPYGNTKYIIELMLKDYCTAYGINSMSFRYFNAAGADPERRLGQDVGATHLVARIMESLVTGEVLTVYSKDYPTRDGTCVRDYAHVCDIAKAHVLGIDYLKKNPGAHIINIGSGTGTTVFEMIHAAERVTNSKVNYEIGPDRIGDPAILVAGTDKAKHQLDWEPEYSVDDIVKHAWQWYRSDIYTELANR